MRRTPIVLAGLALMSLQAVGPQQSSAQDLMFTGQVRPRFEYRDPAASGLEDFTSMRVRLGVEAQVESGLSIFVQTQDVRIWGEESHPLFDFSADNFDLHQGYLRFQGEEWDWLTTTIGRMETPLGGERLIGAVNWTQQGQSFDGLRFDVRTDRTHWVFHGFAVNEEAAPGIFEEEELYGAYGTVEDVGPGALELYWLNDRIEGATDTDEHWLGARYVFDNEIQGRFEATLGTGTRADSDVKAFMFGGRLGTAFDDGRGQATIWYDYLSGDDPTTPEVEVFNTLYATNHKFYGFADLFLNIPAHTGGAGLQDLAVKLDYAVGDQTRAGLDLHTFRAAEGANLTESRFGEELDLTIEHIYSDNFSAMFGLSYVAQAAGLAEIGRLSGDLTWIYVMLNATF